MNIGVVKEIVNNEFRVGLTPTNVAEFINNGHEVFVEKDDNQESFSLPFGYDFCALRRL